jgi:hypothetical protein
VSDQWQAVRDGYKTKEVQVGNCTVRIHRPLLSEEEQRRREEQVRDALRGLVKKG